MRRSRALGKTAAVLIPHVVLSRNRTCDTHILRSTIAGDRIRPFLTKAGHVGLVYRVHGIDYEGLTHQQRQALVHRVEAGLRLLDEHCRLYQYVIKRSIEPIVSAPCQQPIAHEAIQRRAAYLNGRWHQLYDIGLFLVLLYELPHPARRATRLHRVLQAPREALKGYKTRSVFDRYNVVSDGDLRDAARRLDTLVGTLALP
jgi:hypothetical protein